MLTERRSFYMLLILAYVMILYVMFIILINYNNQLNCNNYNGLNWQGCCQVRVHMASIHFLVYYNSKLHTIQFHSFHFFTHVPTFLFQSTLSQHEAEKVGMLVLFCLHFLLVILLHFFFILCFILIFQLAVHLLQISYCMHTCTYQVSHNANVLCCNGCLGKCCMLIAMQCFKVKWLKNDIRQLTLILLVLNHLQFEYTATSTFR